MKKSIFLTALLLLTNTFSQADPIRVIGPKGAVITYEKTNTDVVIRVWPKHADDTDGDTKPILEKRIPRNKFLSQLESHLSSLDKNNLSTEQNELLEKALLNPEGMIQDILELNQLKSDLNKLEAFNSKYPNDCDPNETKTLNDKITSIETRLSKHEDILKAKNLINAILTLIIADIEGNQFTEYVYSEKGSEITFNLLKAVAETIEKCDGIVIDNIKAGTVCVTSKGVRLTRVDRDGFGHAWKDPTGMIWSERIGSFYHDSGATMCRELSSHLPTKEDFERLRSYFDLDQNNYFTDKGRSELYSIMPKMKEHWFWSSSFYDGYSSYYFDGDNGYIHHGVLRFGGDSIVCVAR